METIKDILAEMRCGIIPKHRYDRELLLNFAARFDKVFNVHNEGVDGKLLDAVCESERAAIPFLDAIYLLKGWENSKGAKLELLTALEHGLEIIVEK